jgi:hypothetical protein
MRNTCESGTELDTLLGRLDTCGGESVIFDFLCFFSNHFLILYNGGGGSGTGTSGRMDGWMTGKKCQSFVYWVELCIEKLALHN